MNPARRRLNWLQRLLLGGWIVALAGCAARVPSRAPAPVPDAVDRSAISDARRALVEAEGSARDLWSAELALPPDSFRSRAFSEWMGDLSGLAIDALVLIDRNPNVRPTAVFEAIDRMVNECDSKRARVAATVSPAHFAAMRAALVTARGEVAPVTQTARRGRL